MNAEEERLLRQVGARASPEIVAVYLFGSAGRGEDSAKSDLDLGVLFAGEPPRTLVSAASRFRDDCEAALRRPVDVTVLNAASADLVHRVLRDGKLLLERDPAARVRFEVAKRAEYFDLAPLRALYRRPRPAS